jgi:hypothetical protein
MRCLPRLILRPDPSLAGSSMDWGDVSVGVPGSPRVRLLRLWRVPPPHPLSEAVLAAAGQIGHPVVDDIDSGV